MESKYDNNLSELYWIGTRESEIKQTGGFFKGSITIFGSNHESNFSFDKNYSWRYNYNYENDDLSHFIDDCAAKILAQNPFSKFMLYFPDEIFEYGQDIQKNSVCQNEPELLELLGNKIYSKLWLRDTAEILPYTTMAGKELSISKLQSIFEGYKRFVIQSAYSCGGFGTKLFDEEDESINNHTLYMVTPYIEKNLSVNTHVIIYEEEIIYMPSSVQIISMNEHMFLYKGADFIAYDKVPENIRKSVSTQVQAIAKKLQYCGYRGVCGIDLLYDFEKNIIYYSEINARFQSSTFLLNKVLAPLGQSIQNLHFEAFYNKFCSCRDLLNISIPYSFYSYQYEERYNKQLKFLHNTLIKSANKFEYYDDGLDWNIRLDNYTHLFKIVFQQSIVSWEPDYKVRKSENLTIRPINFNAFEKTTEYFIYLKIALLTQGVAIEAEVMQYIESTEKINCREFEAIDLRLENNLYINVPFEVRLSELSPFTIEMLTDSSYGVCYYGEPLIEAKIRAADPLALRRTKNGYFYEDLTYLGIDRLRVYHRPGCYFKAIDKGCRFCDVDKTPPPFTLADTKEAVNAYIGQSNINHFLIGGGSAAPDSDFSDIIKLSKYIKDIFKKPIYLMSLPPKNNDILMKLYEAGITEVAFNIEIFDRDLARKYMPGKGEIPLEQYFTALENSVKLWGNHGAVRSIFIVGLEPRDSLLKGIEEVCKRGVSPILSIFKAIPNTPLDYIITFSINEIKQIYDETIEICNRYHVELGPQCHFCEDNTLKISFD